MVASRTGGDNRYSTVAEESVIAPPKPCIVWKVRVGSTTIVGAVVGALLNATVPRSLSLSAPSGGVTHTCADTGAGPLGSAAKAPTAAKVRALAAAIAVPSEAAMNLMRDIVVLSLLNQPCGTRPAELAG